MQGSEQQSRSIVMIVQTMCLFQNDSEVCEGLKYSFMWEINMRFFIFSSFFKLFCCCGRENNVEHALRQNLRFS